MAKKVKPKTKKKASEKKAKKPLAKKQRAKVKEEGVTDEAISPAKIEEHEHEHDGFNADQVKELEKSLRESGIGETITLEEFKKMADKMREE